MLISLGIAVYFILPTPGTSVIQNPRTTFDIPLFQEMQKKAELRKALVAEAYDESLVPNIDQEKRDIRIKNITPLSGS